MLLENVKSLLGQEVVVLTGGRPAGPRFVAEFTRLATEYDLVDLVMRLPCSPVNFEAVGAEADELYREFETERNNGANILVIADVTAITGGEKWTHPTSKTVFHKISFEALGTSATTGQVTMIVIASDFDDGARHDLVGNRSISYVVSAIPGWNPLGGYASAPRINPADEVMERGSSLVGETYVVVRNFASEACAQMYRGTRGRPFLPCEGCWNVAADA